MIDSQPTRNLALDLVRVTEAAALAGRQTNGAGDKLAADGAAVNAIGLMLILQTRKNRDRQGWKKKGADAFLLAEVRHWQRTRLGYRSGPD